MIAMMILAQVASAGGESHWDALQTRLASGGETTWLTHTDLDWLTESNSNWDLIQIDKGSILHVDKDFAVVAASLDCLIDGKFCDADSIEEAVLVSVGVGYIVYQQGKYYLPDPLLDGVLTADPAMDLWWADETIDVFPDKTLQGDLVVLTMTKDMLSQDHGGSEPNW